MPKKILFLFFLLVVGFSVWAADKDTKSQEAPAAGTIDDGFLADGIAGWAKEDAAAGVWFFAPDKIIDAGSGKAIASGQRVQMLPCAVLEQIAKLAGPEKQLQIRLWAVFTKYRYANYLYSVYFLPVQAETAKPAAESQSPADAPQKAAATEDSILPEEILAQIKSTRTPDLKKFQQIAQVTGDVNLIGRTGYLIEQNGKRYFQPDGFGMKIDSQPLLLLPNEARQTAERQLNQTPGRQRYSVSGLITTFEGQRYLLLRRAVRTYTHGNFTP